MAKARKPSKKVQAGFDLLLDTYLDTTLPILKKDKFVIAMGMKLFDDGEPGFIGLQPKADTIKGIDMQDHLKAYRTLLKEQAADDCRAVLLAYDVRLHNSAYADAITIELEHASGMRVTLLLPYAFTGIFKKLATGDIQRIRPDTAPIL